MSDAYLSEIRLFGFDFPPTGWMPCDGRLLQINQYQALYSLMGTMYGGDGRSTFGLPDLRGRVPLHMSQQYAQGSAAGEEGHALSTAELPAHNHLVPVSAGPGDSNVPGGNLIAVAEAGQAYMTTGAANHTMAPDAIQSTGSAAGHQNMQPFLCVGFCICVQGIYPQRQ